MPPGSAVVNLSSVMAVTTAKVPAAAYSAAKAGILGLTRDLAAQWGARGIRVNAMLPGVFRTEATAHYSPRYQQAIIDARVPLGRFGDPTEVASTAGLPRLRRRRLHHRPGHRGRRRRPAALSKPLPGLPDIADGSSRPALARRTSTASRDSRHRVGSCTRGPRPRRTPGSAVSGARPRSRSSSRSCRSPDSRRRPRIETRPRREELLTRWTAEHDVGHGGGVTPLRSGSRDKSIARHSSSDRPRRCRYRQRMSVPTTHARS